MKSSETSGQAVQGTSNDGSSNSLGMKRDAARWQWFAAWWFRDDASPEGFMTAKSLEQLNETVDAAIAKATGATS